MSFKAQVESAADHIPLRSANFKIQMVDSSPTEKRGPVDEISSIPIPIPIPIIDFDGDVIEPDNPYSYPCSFPNPDDYLRQMIANVGRRNRRRSLTDYMQISKSMRLTSRLKAIVASKQDVTDACICSTTDVNRGFGSERPSSAMTDCDSPGRASSAPNPMSSNIELCSLLFELGSRRPNTYSSSACALSPLIKGLRSWKIARNGKKSDLKIPADNSRISDMRKEAAEWPSLSCSVTSIDEVREREGEMKYGSSGVDNPHSIEGGIEQGTAPTLVNQSPSQYSSLCKKRLQVPDDLTNLNPSSFVFLPPIHQPSVMLPWSGCAVAPSSPSSSFYVKSNRRGSNDEVINLRPTVKHLNNSISTRRNSLSCQDTMAKTYIRKNGADRNTKINPLSWKNWRDEEILRKLGLSRYNYKTREIDLNNRANDRSSAPKKMISDNIRSAYVVTGLNNYSQEARKQSLMSNEFESFVNNKFNGKMYKNGFRTTPQS